jgi:hypothetical protein
MPRGFHLTAETKSFMVHLRKEKLYSAEEIMNVLFSREDSTTISIKYLETLCRFIDNASTEEINHYRQQASKRGGRRPRMNYMERGILFQMLEDKCNIRLKTLATYFAEQYYDQYDQAPSVSTIFRTLRIQNYTRKVVTRQHILMNDDQRYDYMIKIGYIDPWNLIDIDETASSNVEFEDKYGWAPEGEDAVRMQIKIG